VFRRIILYNITCEIFKFIRAHACARVRIHLLKLLLGRVSLKKEAVQFIKSNKPFRLYDVIVYACVLIILLALFLAFLLPSGSSSNGFEVLLNGESVLTYKYSSDELTILEKYANSVKINDDGSVTVYTSADKSAFNTLNIDKEGKTVKVIDANCSIKKDCVHTPALKGDNGAIICLPHGLKIISLSGYVPPTVG